MKKSFIPVLAVTFAVGLIFAGCSPRASNSTEAINTAKTMETDQEKIDYLMKEARAFVDDKQYNDGIATAQYILSNVDQESEEAQDIIVKARTEMQKTTPGTTERMQEGVEEGTQQMKEGAQKMQEGVEQGVEGMRQ